MKRRILLADDHQLFREALRNLLETRADLEIVAETGTGLDVVNLAREKLPDIVCMDVDMPGMNGIETTRCLIAEVPNIKVIALSAHSEPRYVLDMIRAGASAYVTKAEATGELLQAINAVGQNRKYFGPYVANVIVGALSGGGDQGELHARLGVREREVFRLVVEGYTSTQIANQLHIATTTVEVHRRNIMRKLNVHNVVELTRYAIHHGLVPT